MSNINDYRSNTSLFTNEELTSWCFNAGGHYAQDNQLNEKFFDIQCERSLTIYTGLVQHNLKRYTYLEYWLSNHKYAFHKYIDHMNPVNRKRFDLSNPFAFDPYNPHFDLTYYSDRFVIIDVFIECNDAPDVVEFKYVVNGTRSKI